METSSNRCKEPDLLVKENIAIKPKRGGMAFSHAHLFNIK